MKMKKFFVLFTSAFLLAQLVVVGQATEEHPPRVVSLIAAQFAAGQSVDYGIGMEVQFVNRTNKELKFWSWTTDDAGNNMPVKWSNPAYGGAIDISWGEWTLSPKSSVLEIISSCTDGRLKECPPDMPLKKGWMRFDIPQSWDATRGQYMDDIAVLLVYQITDLDGNIMTTEGVSPTPLGNNFLIPAAIWHDRDFGVAIANFWGVPNTVHLDLYEEGTLIAQKEIVLAPGGQIAKFLREFFPGLPKNRKGNWLNQGSMEIRSERPIGVVSLKIDYKGGFNIAGSPVFPGRTQ